MNFKKEEKNKFKAIFLPWKLLAISMVLTFGFLLALSSQIFAPNDERKMVSIFLPFLFILWFFVLWIYERSAEKTRKMSVLLEENEERFRKLFENAPSGMTLTSPEGKFLRVNKVFCNMVGYSEQELLTKKFKDITHPDDIKESELAVKERLKKQTGVSEFEKRYITKNGKIIWVILRASLLVDGAGRPLYFVTHMFDITERRNSQAKIKHLTEFLNAIREINQIILREKDIVKLLDIVCRILVKTRSYSLAWIGEIRPDSKKIFPIARAGQGVKFLDIAQMSYDDSGEGVCPAGQAIRSRKSAFCQNFNDPKCVFKWKKQALESGFVSTAAIPLIYGDNFFGIISVFADNAGIFGKDEIRLLQELADDVSFAIQNIKNEKARSDAERLLKEAEEKYSTLVEKGNDAIIVLQDEKIKFVNAMAEKMVNMKIKDIVGRNFLDFVAPKFKELAAKNYEARQKGIKIRQRYELDILKKDGSVLPVEVSASIIKFNGRTASLLFVRDISKFKEIDKIKSEFVSVASHQMRTPLTGIKWLLELLKTEKGPVLGAEQNEHLAQIQYCNNQMIKLVDDLLDVSHIEEGKKFAVRLKKENLADIIKEAIDEQRMLAKNGRPTIVMEKGCGDEINVFADKTKIKQVFGILLNNAIKYSSAHGKIEIGCEKQKNRVIYKFKDYGLGIPEKQQEAVFQKFFRGENIVKKSAGTGLGLYIAKAIIEGHNGKIWFESKENKGSAFYVSLPTKTKN